MGDVPPPVDFKNALGKCSFFIILKLLNNNKPYVLSTHKSKIREQNASYPLPVPEKIAKYAPDIKYFERVHLRLFMELNV